MNSTMLAQETAGVAAVARIDMRLQTLGYGWHQVTNPCAIPNFDMASTKRPPRRLGMRST